MSENDIKPVAWVDIECWRATNDAGGSFFTDYQDEETVAVYDQPAIDRLMAERDAAVADAERLDWIVRVLRHDYARWTAVVDHNQANVSADQFRAAIDAARSEGK